VHVNKYLYVYMQYIGKETVQDIDTVRSTTSRSDGYRIAEFLMTLSVLQGRLLTYVARLFKCDFWYDCTAFHKIYYYYAALQICT